jgi:hypothetical protein
MQHTARHPFPLRYDAPPMYNLSRFGFNDMMDCRTRLRTIFEEDPASIEEAAQRVVEFFYRELVDDHGKPACALVRLFKTHPYSDLGRDLQRFAAGIVPEVETVAGARCLVLLATEGEEPAWRSRHLSGGHKAIPLTSEQMVRQAPMIAQLLEQFGVPVSAVLRPNPSLMLDARDKVYNVFHVERALGSPYIVAQKEFVEPFRIASVLGFGGLLSSGDLFATIMFSRVPISAAVADQFKVVGLNLKLAMLPMMRKPVFS